MRLSYLSFLILASAGLSAQVAHAQSSSLPGEVVIQNSEYETGHRILVKDASVRAPFAKPAISDGEGQFTLTFAGVASGTPVRVSVNKPGLELVNEQEFQNVILGRSQRLRAVMADPEKLAEAQVKYYHIAMSGITGSFEQRLAALRDEKRTLEARIAQVNAEHDSKVATLYEAIELLTEQRDKAVEHAQELATDFATVNLDDASDRYRRAFELFREGKLDSVLLVLNAQDLEADYHAAKEAMASARAEMARLLDSYQLKVNVLKATISFNNCLAVLDEMIAMIDAEPGLGDMDRKGEVLFQKAEVLSTMARYSEAEEAIRESIAAGRKFLGREVPSHAVRYSTWGAILLTEDKLDSGMAVLARGMALLDTTAEEQALFWAELESNIGVGFSLQGKYALAIQHQQHALDLRTQRLPADHQDLLISLANLGTLKFKMGQFEASLVDHQRCLDLWTAKNPRPDPFQGMILNNMANACQESKQLDRALVLYGQARSMFEHVFGPDHPLVVYTYHGRSMVNFKAGRYDLALAQIDSGIVIAQRVLPPDHQLFFNLYGGRAMILGDMGRYDESIAEHEKGIALMERKVGAGHPNVAVGRANMAVIQRQKRDYEGAMRNFLEAYDIYVKVVGPDHPNSYIMQANVAATLSDLGRKQEAADKFAEVMPKLAPLIGKGSRSYAGLEGMMGVNLFNMERYAEADSLLRHSQSVRPTSDAAWCLHLIDIRNGDEPAALEKLVECVRLRSKEKNVLPAKNEEARLALREMATRLGRKDLLEEFDLH